MNTQWFLGTIGINTALSYPGTPYYNNARAVLGALQYLGIDTVRNMAADLSDPTTWAVDSALADAGIKFDFILHGGNVDIAGDLSSLDAFEQQHPGSIVGIEGPNEINDQAITYNGITDTFAAGAQFTQDLWSAVQSDPTLAGVPVYELSVSDGFTDIRSGETELGNLSSDVTYNNVHIYGSGGENLWSDAMPYWLPIEQESAPDVPTVVTETGYQTSGQAGTDAVDQTVAAKYDLNTVFDEAGNGIAFTYFYDLAETSPQTYGFFNSDWSAKTPAVAMHNLTTILGAAGAGDAPGTLNYSLSGLPSTGHSLLLGSASTYDLAIWNDVTIWDEASGTEISAPAQTVTVNLGGTYSNVSVYDPMVGTGAIASYSNVSSLQVSLVDHPLIVQVSGGGGAAVPAMANDAVVYAGSGDAITDGSGHTWTITGDHQVAVDGTTDTTTSGVALLAYVDGEVWQENVLGMWCGRTQPTGAWSVGISVSPLPPSGAAAAVAGGVVSVPVGQADVSVTVSGSVVDVSGGDHLVFISGGGDTFDFGSGTETVFDNGGGGNIFALPAAGDGTVAFNGSVLGNGDRFDLTAALAGTQWDGSAGMLGSFLHTVQVGAGTELLVSAQASASAAGTVVATFDDVAASVPDILGHSVT
jgi:hypothetical protein